MINLKARIAWAETAALDTRHSMPTNLKNDIHPMEFREVLAAYKRLCPVVMGMLWLDKFRGKAMVAGGAVSSAFLGQPPKDIDIFTDTRETALALAEELIKARGDEGTVVVTPNSITIPCSRKDRPRPALQVIIASHGPLREILEGFDFTICQGAIYYEDSNMAGLRSTTYFPDLMTKKLVYTSSEKGCYDPAGTLRRMVKFLGQGYTIDLDDVARIVDDVLGSGCETAAQIYGAMTGLRISG